MLKNSLYLLLFTLSLTSCKQKRADYIDLSEVSSIEIVKKAGPKDSILYEPKKLGEKEIKSFVEKFNETTESKLIKFLPSYQVSVHFNDKSTRTFYTTSRHIHEKTDESLDFGQHYFEKLSNNL